MQATDLPGQRQALAALLFGDAASAASPADDQHVPALEPGAET